MILALTSWEGFSQRVSDRWLNGEFYLTLMEHLFSTALMICLAILLSYALELAFRRMFLKLTLRPFMKEAQIRKALTIESVLISTIRYSIAFIILFKILILWGVPKDSLTIGGAILASAIGFGSQGLIQDVITGFSLLFEEQLRIGDFVDLNGKQGHVREVGLRVVKIRGLDGSEHTFFNRQITMVSTLTGPPSPPTP